MATTPLCATTGDGLIPLRFVKGIVLQTSMATSALRVASLLASPLTSFAEYQLLSAVVMTSSVAICSRSFRLETSPGFEHSAIVQTMEKYRRQALKLAEVSFLGEDEGFASRIPGFRGLIATGETKRQALPELETALTDWMDLALKRGLGLPPVHVRSAAELVSAH